MIWYLSIKWEIFFVERSFSPKVRVLLWVQVESILTEIFWNLCWRSIYLSKLRNRSPLNRILKNQRLFKSTHIVTEEKVFVRMTRHLSLPLTLDLQLRYEILWFSSLIGDRPLYLFLCREVSSRTILLLVRLMVASIRFKCSIWLYSSLHFLFITPDNWLNHLPHSFYLTSHSSLSLFKTLVDLL